MGLRARLVAATSALLLLVAAGATPVAANHNVVQASFTITQKGIDGPNYVGTGVCDGATCQVFVTVTNRRDAGRIARLCGATSVSSVIFANQVSQSFNCAGNGGWGVRVGWTSGTLSGGNFTATAHPADISVSAVLFTP